LLIWSLEQWSSCVGLFLGTRAKHLGMGVA
jgi:hypothetical protein